MRKPEITIRNANRSFKMRVLLIALASLAVNVIYWLKYRGVEFFRLPLLAERDVQKDLILLAVSVYLVFEGLALMRKNQKQKQLIAKLRTESQEIGETDDQLDQLYQQRELFQAEVTRARDELSYVSRRLQTMTEERDLLRATMQELQSRSQGPSSMVSAPMVSAQTAVPMNRGMRIGPK